MTIFLLHNLAGEVTKESLSARLGSANLLMVYISMFSKYVLPNLSIEGTKCNGSTTDINFIAAGSSGATFSFSCDNKKNI